MQTPHLTIIIISGAQIMIITGTSILDRYRKYNGIEGNSVASGQATPGADVESYPVQATTIPDGEDINHDNTINQSESYFQYKVTIASKQNGCWTKLYY